MATPNHENNKKRFQVLHAKIIEAIIHSTLVNKSEPFWWLLLHLELLILCPTNKHNRDNSSLTATIHQRLDDLQTGNIEALFIDAFRIRSHNTTHKPPHNNGNTAAQIAADSDNYRTAIARLNTTNPIATINRHNIRTVKNLNSEPLPHRNFQPPNQPTQTYHLPGDICHTIKHAPKHKGTGLLADSIDIFTSLVNLNNTHINQNIHSLFNLIYTGQVPSQAHKFFTDTYLFCLHKDTNDPTKLRPIGIPTAIRRIITSHIANTMKDKFSAHLLPFNYAVGVNDGMDFIIKAMQLSIERNIIIPQSNDLLPTRAALFIDLTNMFNNVSREELFDIINTHFPELTALTTLIYNVPATVHFKYNNTSWKNISMQEGVNQGCPLSSTFAALVMNRVLQPLDTILRKRAQDRLRAGNVGDNGFGSITHLFAWVDDISATVPHEDITTFLHHLDHFGRERGCYIKPHKSRILTSCNNTSIIPRLQNDNPTLATKLTNAIATYSTNTQGTTSTAIELTDGFRLLGTPVGSPSFADAFYQEQLLTAFQLTTVNTQITDLQTRLKLFSTCILQKLPHLLSSDAMHHLPLDFDPSQWPTYAGPLSNGIHNLIDTFLQQLLQLPELLPDHSKCISHLPINHGGLGLLFPRHRTTSDFVITMTIAIRNATTGFRQNKDITPTRLHPSITNLFSTTHNPHSQCLARYHLLLPHIAQIACSDKCPPQERLQHTQTKLSAKSMRDRIKKHCANILSALTYEITFTTSPEHAHLLPSILTPITSYPFIGMNRSNPTNRLSTCAVTLAIQRKLRLPIYNTTNPPRCSCGITHDPWGDHAFRCKKHNKKFAHNFIRDNWATTLQPALALAGYISDTSPIQTELPFLTPNDISARPFDISFDPEPHPSRPTACNCPYTTIGADITITHSMDPPDIDLSADVQHRLKAAADKHLQDVEKAKNMRDKHVITNPSTNTTRTVYGETIIDDLLQANTILIPIVFDPHSNLGPIARAFLSTSDTTIEPITFPRT